MATISVSTGLADGKSPVGFFPCVALVGQNNDGPAINHPPGPSVLLTVVRENHDGPTICNPPCSVCFVLIGLVGAIKKQVANPTSGSSAVSLTMTINS